MPIPDIINSGNRCELHGGIIDCPCQRERITISLPALRATLFRVIDTEEWRFYNWNWANSDTADAEATEHRVKFADAVCDRLRQLPARG